MSDFKFQSQHHVIVFFFVNFEFYFSVGLTVKSKYAGAATVEVVLLSLLLFLNSYLSDSNIDKLGNKSTFRVSTGNS